MKFRLLSAAALSALSVASASAPGGDEDDGAPAPGQGGTETAPTPTPTPTRDAAGGDPAPDQPTDVVVAADAKAAIAGAHGTGYAAANDRMTAVFASAEGKANPQLASFLLANSTAAAPAIIDQLKAQGVAPAPAASTAAAIPATKVDLGAGTDPTGLAAEGSDDAAADAGWDKAQAKTAGSMGIVVPIGAQAGVAAASAAGASFVTSAAVPPTGN